MKKGVAKDRVQVNAQVSRDLRDRTSIACEVLEISFTSIIIAAMKAKVEEAESITKGKGIVL